MLNFFTSFSLVLLPIAFVFCQQSTTEKSITNDYMALNDENNDSKNNDYSETLNLNSLQNIKLFVQRNGSEVLCNISNPHYLTIEKLFIERKTSANLSDFKTIRTLNSSELENLNFEGKVIVNDKYPESNKLDAYYRIKFQDKKGMFHILSEFFLQKQNAFSTELEVNNNLEDSDFVNEDDTLKYFSDDFGLKIIAEPQITSVTIKLENVGFNYNPSGKWYIERKSENFLANYKLVKPLSEYDIQKILEDGIFEFNDKYPESRKLDAYYRLKYEDELMEFEVVFEPILVSGIKAK